MIRWLRRLFAGFPGCGGGQQAGDRLIALEQKRHALGFRRERFFAVRGVDGAIQPLMRAHQFRRRGQRVVQIGQRGIGRLRAGVEHGLRGGFDGLALCVSEFRPREVVLDDPGGITVIAFQPPAYGAHPGVVHRGSEDTEVVEGGIGNY